MSRNWHSAVAYHVGEVEPDKRVGVFENVLAFLSLGQVAEQDAAAANALQRLNGRDLTVRGFGATCDRPWCAREFVAIVVRGWVLAPARVPTLMSAWSLGSMPWLVVLMSCWYRSWYLWRR